jgi:hypothetical protein
MPLGIAAASAFALAVVFSGERKLEACTDPAVDPDHDFLCTVQERILGTSPTIADTDQDGYDDLEELARGSSPLSYHDVPTPREPVHLGLTAHGGDDGLHILVAVHSADMNLRDTILDFGVQSGRQMMTVPSTWLASRSTSQLTTDGNGTGLIQLIDVMLDPALVHAMGQLTFYATASIAGSGTVSSADAVRFLSIDGFVVLAMAPPRPIPHPPGQQVPGPGSIYVPLPTGGTGGGGGAPSSWSAGEICFQRTSPVAVNGPVVTSEVVSAECMNGWEGYCPPTCTASVGSTFATVDPVGLIGG